MKLFMTAEELEIVRRAETADAGRDHMRDVSGEAANVSERSDWAALVVDGHGLRGVLDNAQLVLRSDFEDGVHVAR